MIVRSPVLRRGFAWWGGAWPSGFPKSYICKKELREHVTLPAGTTTIVIAVSDKRPRDNKYFEVHANYHPQGSFLNYRLPEETNWHFAMSSSAVKELVRRVTKGESKIVYAWIEL